MKKILLMMVFLITLIVMPTSASASDKVKIYMFRGKTCEHCESALNYINNHRDEISENIELVTFEVWDNQNNAKLQDKVADKLEVDKSKNYGVPFFVIGNQYIKGYSDATTFKEILNIAESYVGNNEYKDVVEEVRREERLEVVSNTLDDLFSKPNKVVTIIVYAVFGIALVGVIAMIMFGRRS